MLVLFVVVVGSTTLYLRWSRPSLIPAAGVDLGVDAYACCCRCAARGAANRHHSAIARRIARS
jgi:hypothetical protein